VALQDGSNRTASDFVPKIGKCSLNPAITPSAVLFRHAHDQGFDFTRCGRSPWPAPSGTIVLLCNQFPMPGEQSLWSDDSGDLGQEFLSQSLSSCRQTPPLIIVQPEPPSAKLFPKGPCSVREGSQSSEDGVDSSSQGYEHEPKWI
jgi:hypothetical protein